MLRPGGFLCLRLGTIGNVRSHLWLRFFPAALEIDMARLPARQGLLGEVTAAGFECHAQETLNQRVASDHAEYLERIGRRAISTLQMISDREFAEGLAAFEAYCRPRASEGPIYEELDLLLFRTPPARGD